MLRVTIKKEDSSEIWESRENSRVNGYLNEALWRKDLLKARFCKVHLKAVTISTRRKAMLAEMRQQGAEIKGAGAWSGHLLRRSWKERDSGRNGLRKAFYNHRVSGFLLGGAAILCAEHRPRLAFGLLDRVPPAHQLGGTSVKY